MLNSRALLFTLLCFIMMPLLAANTSAIRATKKTQQTKDPKAYTTINISYPVFSDHPHAKTLNQTINDRVEHIVTAYKADIQSDRETAAVEAKSKLPRNPDSNTLIIDYKIFTNPQKIVSVRFKIDSNYYGAAHPNTTFESLNFDLNHGKTLTLGEIFPADSEYLHVLAGFSETELKKKLTREVKNKEKVMPFVEGVKPTPENYKIWNLTDQGLLLTFPPYQVAPYVFGPQEITFPYVRLKKLMQ